VLRRENKSKRKSKTIVIDTTKETFRIQLQKDKFYKIGEE
jgi:hypothetical protein